MTTPSAANSVAGFVRRHAGFLALALVVMTIPAYLGDRYYLSILAFMGTRFMMALGLSLLLGQAGQISLGQAAFVGIGAYGSAILTTKAGMDPWAAMVIAAILSATIAGLVGMPTLRLRGYYLAMATLGVNEIVYILIVQLKSLTNGTDGITGIPGLRIGGLDLSGPKAYHLVVWGVALLMFRVALNLSTSRVGRSLRALHRSEAAAQSLGIDTSYRKVQIFMIAAAFASIAGSFDAYFVHFISPEGYTVTFSIILITGVIIGGLGTLWGAVWGTVVIVILPELLGRLNDDVTNLVFGVLLIAIMMFWRSGNRSLWQTVKGWRPPKGGDGVSAGMGESGGASPGAEE
jgi:branched-chain amino acid transport system permease protein